MSEPARLLSEPQEPLEAGPLDPVGGGARSTGEQIEQAADPDHRRREAGRGRAHPVVLCGGAHPDPDHVRLRGPDLGDDPLGLAGGHGAPRRRVGSRDQQPGDIHFA